METLSPAAIINGIAPATRARRQLAARPKLLNTLQPSRPCSAEFFHPTPNLTNRALS